MITQLLKNKGNNGEKEIDLPGNLSGQKGFSRNTAAGGTPLKSSRRNLLRGEIASVKLFLPKKRSGKFLAAILGLLLFTVLINLTVPGVVLAEQSEMIEISGEGVTNPVVLTLAQLEAMEQYQHVYSAINTWPTKKWYVARGVKIRDLFSLAGLKEDATLIRFLSGDGFEVALTVKELLQDKRYYFPRLMENHPSDGTIPGSPVDGVEVEPILALISAEDSNKPVDMNDRDALLLVLGQRVVSEQTNSVFLKYINRIEVQTTPLQKWDNPRADLEEGEVPAGSQVKLSNKRNDIDKIYYTTDGSTPDFNSPVFNKSSSRWWPLRPDDLDLVNQPINIDKDTVIKAITIGPGKQDSDVVTFTYKADFTGRAAERAKLPGGPPTGVTLDQAATGLNIGSSIELTATVGPGNAIDKSVIWSSSDPSVATVDGNGLVTVVGPGTAIITVKTVTGGRTATCVVNAFNRDSEGGGSVPEAATAQNIEVMALPVEPPVPEPEEQPEAETAAAELENPEVPEEQARPVEPEGEDEPEENGQYLMEKDPLAAAAAEDTSAGQLENQMQVFEMSVAVEDTEPQAGQGKTDLYTAGIFIALFLLGASRRYLEYVREAKS
jgi:hypothetical protein